MRITMVAAAVAALLVASVASAAQKPVSVSEFLEVLDEVLGEAETRFG